MREIPRAAIIPTHNRPAELRRCVEAIAPQVDLVVVVDNASDPPVNLPHRVEGGRDSYDLDTIPLRVMLDPEQPPNLSRLWNRGLDYVAEYFRGGNIDAYDVAVLNDDAIVPAGWFDLVSAGLRGHPTAAVACTHAYEPATGATLRTAPDGDLWNRMCPWAFVARGELSQRSNETLRWWWFDTAWDWEARKLGGVLTVPGPVVPNTCANSSTVGVLAEQAGRDRERFGEIYGSVPW